MTTADLQTLLAIRDQLDGVEWSSRTLDEIAAILIEAGFRIRDMADAEVIDNLTAGEFVCQQ